MTSPASRPLRTLGKSDLKLTSIGFGAWAIGGSWGDYDNDGNLDLIVTNYSNGKNNLYHNSGPPNYNLVSVDTGIVSNEPANSVGSCWGDFNNDGNLDLFVSVIQGPNLLFTNRGNGTFSRVPTGPLVTGSYVSAGCAWGDYDNDGFPDMFVSVNGNPPNNDLLYHNNGNGTFTQISTGSIVNSGGKGNACAWGDYDNDGYLDLYVINSDQNNFLFHNNGDGTFTRITSGPLVTQQVGTGIMTADTGQDTTANSDALIEKILAENDGTAGK